MRYQITISELKDSTNDYRRDDEYVIYEAKVEGDGTIVPAIQRVVVEYVEDRYRVGAGESDE